MVYKSVADEVKEFLSVSREPKTLKEINTALGNKYTTSDLNKHIRYWEKKGVISSNIKIGYARTKEYCLTN
jgi:hypothetical protein